MYYVYNIAGFHSKQDEKHVFIACVVNESIIPHSVSYFWNKYT